MTIRFFPFLLLHASRPSTGLLLQNQLVDCKFSAPNGPRYDLNNLIDPKSWPLNLTTIKSTPPSTTIESIFLSVCKKLPFDKSGHPSCPDGSLVCMYIYNQIGSDRRLEKIIPVGVDKLPSIINVAKTADKEWLELIIKGSVYNDIQQSTIFNLFCSEGKSKESPSPSTIYDPVNGILNVNWTTPAACASSNGDNSTYPQPSTPFKKFIFFLFVIFSAYLIIGVWYNFKTYGLTGADALPHQTFWRELPRNTIDFIRSIGRQMKSGQAPRHGYTPI